MLPEVVIPHNHCTPLIDLTEGKVFPMVSIGDFTLEDKIFPGSPGDSLLYTDTEVVKLQERISGCQVPIARGGIPASSAHRG